MPDKADDKNYRACKGQYVGGRIAEPYTFYAEGKRQQIESGQQEDELSAEGEENTLPHHSEALEKVRADNLETYYGEGEIHQAHPVDCKPFELGVVGEHRNRGSGEKFEDKESGRSHQGGPEHAEPVNLLDSPAFAGAEIVTCNGLHALVDAHYDHQE